MRDDLAPTLEASSEALAILRHAASLAPPGRDRVIAASDGPSPREGLALLSAYLKIADADRRQEILDAVTAIAGGACRI